MSRLPILLLSVIVTLAFTNSATVPVGFPLKIYELLGAVAIMMMLSGGLDLGRFAKIPMLWTAFAGCSLFASAYGLNIVFEHGTHMLEWAHGRYQPLVNTIFHYCYLLFDIGIMVLVIHCLQRGLISARQFVKFWLIGSLLAVIYALALNLVVYAGINPAVLLRWDTIQYITMAGVNIARTGPFREGNYFGLYLVLSLVLNAWALQHYRDRFFNLMVVVLLIGIMICASPTAIMSAMVMLLMALISGGVSPLLRMAAAVCGVVVVVVMIQTGLMQTLIIDKFSLIFFGGVTDTHNVSLVQRVNESYHAWQMFLDHPFGIGMGNFGYLFGDYPDLFMWLQTDFVNVKRIVNNVYLEVLCEHGFLLGGLFLYLLLSIIVRLTNARQWLLIIGMLLLMVYFLAFPTFRLTLVWAFWGFAVWAGKSQPEPAAVPIEGSDHAR